MINYFLFLITNYLIGVCFAAAFGFIYGHFNGNTFHAQTITRQIIIKLYTAMILLISITRVHFMEVSDLDSLKYIIVGTIGTLLFRESLGNAIQAFTIHSMQKKSKQSS